MVYAVAWIDAIATSSERYIIPGIRGSRDVAVWPV